MFIFFQGVMNTDEGGGEVMGLVFDGQRGTALAGDRERPYSGSSS